MKKLLLFLALVFSLSASEPFVILVSFDGFRWDYVNRGITPNIQNLIDDGVHALSLRPAFPTKTFPNHYSIITGMYPVNHGLVSNNFRMPKTGEWYSMGDAEGSKNNPKWYLGEAFWETAEKNGIISASYFWPGSTLNDPERRPTYSKKYDRSVTYRARIDSAISWLQMPDEKRPHFISLYFEDTDDYGHAYGPNSEEISTSIKRCDSLAGYLVEELRKIGMADSVNIILTSDHGMTEISKERVINIEEKLKGLEYYHSDNGPFMLIQPAENDREQIKNILEANQDNYKFYLKNEVPEYYHYSDSERLPEFILIADLGWFLAHEKDIAGWDNYGSAATHGFDHNASDMHALFIAKGPVFKSGYKTGTVWNVDIYPLLSEIFGAKYNHKIDGDLIRIAHILR